MLAPHPLAVSPVLDSLHVEVKPGIGGQLFMALNCTADG
ncbi:hypothetical protein SAMN05216604_10475 [Pseudomonas agarici]|nr:hypothetical protein SAMN05216604_10475 [Pseudomonas agarici]